MEALVTEPASYVLLDLFPCTVEGPLGPVSGEARVIVTDNHFYVFVDAPRGPEIVVKAPLKSPIDGSLTTGYTISGYKVVKKASCGCGSRLRSIYPFLGVPFQQTT